MSEIARLRWRCRRGMKELDFLLGRYLERDYPVASAEEQAGFREFLDLPDPVIFGWLTGREAPPRGVMSAIVDRLVQHPAD